MPINFRPTRLDEIDATDALVVSSINDLTERHGFGRMASRSPPAFQAFSLADDPRGLWTAEEDGELAGFAWSWVREDFWFLAQLFVEPGMQTGGIGRELLRRTLDHADHVRAKQRGLITFAFNTVSQGLYIRHGFLPRFLVYSMSVTRERIAPGESDGLLDVRALDGSAEQAAALSEIDRLALGFARGGHHRLLTGEPGARGFGLHDAGRLVGSFYISAGGHIGPIAVTSPDLLDRAFSAALAIASDASSPNVSCFLPGTNAVVLRRALDRGLRIRFPMLWMSTQDSGGWLCYLPRNPGFM